MTEFTPGTRPPGPDCEDRAAWGEPSNLDQYISKQFILAEEDYPPDACQPYKYHTAKIDNWEVTTAMTGALTTINTPSAAITCASLSASGTVSGATGSFSVKPFNIPHPSPDKEGMRLVHACLEGPENGVYFRGRVTNKKEILLPPYWKDLVDWTTITVNLTPIGSHQSVIVKRFDEDKIYLQSNGGMPIDCFYHVYGTRKDIAPLPIEMEKDEPWPYS